MSPLSYLVVRKEALHETERSTGICTASGILLSVTILAFVARQVTKAVVSRRLAIDDFFAFLATGCAVGVSSVTIVLASHGLDMYKTLPFGHNSTLMKGHFASEILYISTICFAKLSILVIFHTIFQKQRTHRRSVLIFGYFILAWSVASGLAVVLRCALPNLLKALSSQSVNARIFWVVYCSIDAITELLIISTSILLVTYLQVPTIRRFAIVACFAPRALVACVAILRLTWLYPPKSHTNTQYRLWVPAIITQVQLCLSICTACVPYMVPFFRALDRTIWRSNSIRSRKNYTQDTQQRVGSSLWFRRQNARGKNLTCWGSAATTNAEYRHVSHTSIQSITPTLASPMTPQQSRSPQIRSSSKNGLCISIPLIQRAPEYDQLTSRTASSFTLSPTCASPQPLLTTFVPVRKAPSPPSKTYSPGMPFKIPYETSLHDDPPRSQQFSLFPSQPKRSPIPHHSSKPTADHRSKRSPLPSSSLKGLSKSRFGASHESTPGTKTLPNSSTTPALQLPPHTTLSARFPLRPDSTQDLNSPMGAALENFFSGTAQAVLAGGGHVRNDQVSSPLVYPAPRVGSEIVLRDARSRARVVTPLL